MPLRQKVQMAGPSADVARPVTDACEREHPPMESISAAWQGLTRTDAPDLDTETHTELLVYEILLYSVRI